MYDQFEKYYPYFCKLKISGVKEPCGKVFINKNTLTQHIKNFHGDFSNLLCELCGEFMNLRNLKYHQKHHHGSNVF